MRSSHNSSFRNKAGFIPAAVVLSEVFKRTTMKIVV
mgnify:CR=1 FL=1